MKKKDADSNRNDASSSLLQRFFVGAFGVIVLGAVGSGVWDAIAKPGLGWVGRTMLAMLSLGGTTLKDAAYASAALDPTPLPALLLMTVCATLPLWFVFGFVAAMVRTRQLTSRVARKTSLQGDEPPDPSERVAQLEAEIDSLAASIRRKATVGIVGGCVLLAVALIGSSVTNQAVLIHRVFNANLAIVAPDLTPQQEREYRARFAMVQSAAHYQALAGLIDSVATVHKRTLVTIALW